MLWLILFCFCFWGSSINVACFVYFSFKGACQRIQIKYKQFFSPAGTMKGSLHLFLKWIMMKWRPLLSESQKQLKRFILIKMISSFSSLLFRQTFGQEILTKNNLFQFLKSEKQFKKTILYLLDQLVNTLFAFQERSTYDQKEECFIDEISLMLRKVYKLCRFILIFKSKGTRP